MDGDGNIFAWLVAIFILYQIISTLIPMILIGVGIFMLISIIFTKTVEKYDENKRHKELMNQNYDSILANSFEAFLQVDNKTEGMMNVWLQLGTPVLSTPVMFEKNDGQNEKMSYKFELLADLNAISGSMFANEQYNPSARVLKLKYKENDKIYSCDIFSSPYRAALISSMDGKDYLEIIK